MPFKIVQTLEGGFLKLTVIPALWEAKGILLWPSKNTKNPGTLIKDGNSRPGPGWTTINCILKRNNIRTFEEANKELNNMEQNTDTDSQENEYYALPEVSSLPGTSKTSHPAQNVDFEAVANHLTNQIVTDGVLVENIETVQGEISQEQDTTIQLITSDNLNTILGNQTLILNKLQCVLENQKNIAKKLASLSVQLDETNKEIIDLKQKQQCDVTLLQDTSLEERESFSLKPIDNAEEFKIFELSLADKAYKKKLVNCLATLYSPKHGEGQTCAYKLIDVLFTKEFLCQCSWSGGSKGERSKIPMKNLTNFRKFFFIIVNMWDPSFTDDQMLKFFKVVLRNATKRKSMQGLRISTKRVRTSKQKVKVDNAANSPEGNDNSQPRAADGDGGEPEAASVDGVKLKAKDAVEIANDNIDA